MTERTEDFKDYLNQQAQAAQVEQRLQNLLSDPEQVAEDGARAVESAAHQAISEIADEVTLLEDGVPDSAIPGADDDDQERRRGPRPGLADMVVEARNLRKQVQAGTISVSAAKTALITLREHHTATAESIAVLRARYDDAVNAAKNPAARRDEFLAKYPGLRR